MHIHCITFFSINVHVIDSYRLKLQSQLSHYVMNRHNLRYFVIVSLGFSFLWMNCCCFLVWCIQTHTRRLEWNCAFQWILLNLLLQMCISSFASPIHWLHWWTHMEFMAIELMRQRWNVTVVRVCCWHDEGIAVEMP